VDNLGSRRDRQRSDINHPDYAFPLNLTRGSMIA
jgi:hypothetical protein